MNKFITLSLFVFLSLVLFLTGCDGFNTNTNTTQKEENTTQQNPALYTTTFTDEADFDYLQTNSKNTLKNKKEDACIVYYAVEKKNGKYRYKKGKLNLFLPENVVQGETEQRAVQYVLSDQDGEVLRKANCVIPKNDASGVFLVDLLKYQQGKTVRGGKKHTTKLDPNCGELYYWNGSMCSFNEILVEGDPIYNWDYFGDPSAPADSGSGPYAQWDPYYDPYSGGGGGGGSDSGSSVSEQPPDCSKSDTLVGYQKAWCESNILNLTQNAHIRIALQKIAIQNDGNPNDGVNECLKLAQKGSQIINNIRVYNSETIKKNNIDSRTFGFSDDYYRDHIALDQRLVDNPNSIYPTNAASSKNPVSVNLQYMLVHELDHVLEWRADPGHGLRSPNSDTCGNYKIKL